MRKKIKMEALQTGEDISEESPTSWLKNICTGSCTVAARLSQKVLPLLCPDSRSSTIPTTLKTGKQKRQGKVCCKSKTNCLPFFKTGSNYLLLDCSIVPMQLILPGTAC